VWQDVAAEVHHPLPPIGGVANRARGIDIDQPGSGGSTSRVVDDTFLKLETHGDDQVGNLFFMPRGPGFRFDFNTLHELWPAQLEDTSMWQANWPVHGLPVRLMREDAGAGSQARSLCQDVGYGFVELYLFLYLYIHISMRSRMLQYLSCLLIMSKSSHNKRCYDLPSFS
jgi:hypothetical protein